MFPLIKGFILWLLERTHKEPHTAKAAAIPREASDQCRSLHLSLATEAQER